MIEGSGTDVPTKPGLEPILYTVYIYISILTSPSRTFVMNDDNSLDVIVNLPVYVSPEDGRSCSPRPHWSDIHREFV